MNKRKYGEHAEEEELQPLYIPFEELYERIIAEARMLNEEEFSLISDRKTEYAKYVARFYDLNLKELLVKGFTRDVWFVERDLCMLWMFSDTFMQFRDFISNRPASLALEARNAQSLLESDLFSSYREEEGEKICVVVIRHIDQNFSIKDFIGVVQEKAEIKEWALSQHGVKEGFKKTLYVRLENQNGKEFTKKIAEDLPKGASASVLEPLGEKSGTVREVGRQYSDKYAMQLMEQTCRKILKGMSGVFSVPEVQKVLESLETKVKEEERADLYALALRKIFNFCYYCGAKFDSPYEMIEKCGLFHVRSSTDLDLSNPARHSKKMDFYAIDREECFKHAEREVDLGAFCEEKEERDAEYVCKYCGKRFAAKEYFEKHLLRKHVEYETYTRLVKDCAAVLGSLNYQVVEFVEQRHQHLPYYLYRYMVRRKAEKEEMEAAEVSYASLEKKYPVSDRLPITVTDDE